ncbi:LytR family transcriptional regulator [Patescibacteria group bacterium]|nr:MAG: LytR family transcriptional regulator [Patescibacteria group bacterium]
MWGIGKLSVNDDIIIYQDELESSPRPKPPRRYVKWLKRLAIVAVVIGAAVAAYLVFNLSKVSVNPFGFGKLKGESDGRVNIMMLGVGDPGHAGEKLSDTNIILSVDTRNHTVAMIGIPRDLRVDIPDYGESKINNAYAQGGLKVAKQTYEDSFGVPIHYYVKANFTGLKDVVDAVGGVEVDNKQNLYDPEYPCDKNQYRSCGFRLAAGRQKLDGNTALKYVRCRKGTCGNDFGRAERQQQVMQAIRDKATSAGTLANPVALGKLVGAAGKNIETDLSINNLMRLRELTDGLDQSRITNVVFNLDPDGFLISSNNSSDLVPASGDFDDIQLFVKSIFTMGPIWAEHSRVVIENGTTTTGLAGKLQDQLKTKGYPLGLETITNALKRDYTTTQIIDYSGGKKPKTVDYLKHQLKVEPTTPEALGLPASAIKPGDVVVILGSDYAATVSGSSSTGSSSTGSGSSSTR